MTDTTAAPLTEQQLDDIEARANAATKGPWEAEPHQHFADGCRCLSCYDDPTGWQIDHPDALDCEEFVAATANDFGRDRASCDTGPLLPYQDANFAAHAREDVPALVAEVRRLRAELAQDRENYRAYRIGAEGAKRIAEKRIADLDRALGETIDDRDRMHEIADKLAYAVAPEEVIGEHSSMNCPWTNALELITPKAEVDKLRARIAELERPAVEAKRAEIRSSYVELIAQAEQDRDYEGAFDVQCRLREREEQWAREDAATAEPSDAAR